VVLGHSEHERFPFRSVTRGTPPMASIPGPDEPGTRWHKVNIPAEMSIIGIDNHEMSSVVGLTTVGQDPVNQGAT
jgi:hypothetical protein